MISSIFCLFVFNRRSVTHGSQYAVNLTQSLRYVVHGAEHQGADDRIHRVVLDGPHVLPGRHHEPVVGQVVVVLHAFGQVLLELRVRVGADHLAAVRVVLEVRPGAAADLQERQLATGGLELGQAPEQLLLLVVHFFVVHLGNSVQADGHDMFVELVEADGVDQMEGQTQHVDHQSADPHQESHLDSACTSACRLTPRRTVAPPGPEQTEGGGLKAAGQRFHFTAIVCKHRCKFRSLIIW